MACDKSFCSNYLLLSPEKAGVIDLLRILIYSDVHKREFLDSSEEGEESFERRWIMFVSILVQKLLLLVAKPLSLIGSVIKFLLNLLSSNRNFGRLLVNCFRGQSAYLVIAIWHNKMDFLGSYNFWNDYQRKVTTHAFMLRDRDTIMVAFRGTEPFNAADWCLDFDLSRYELPGVGNIHGGFMKALGLQKTLGWPKELDPLLKTPAPFAYYAIREKLRSLLGENDKVKYVLTGHSLGGALAILFPAILAIHGETWLMERLEGVYTFGQPRVGDDKFGEFMERVLKEYRIAYFRFVYANDIVPRLPFDDSASMFTHFGRCCYFNSKYQGKVIPEEPNKNYFSPLPMIPMMINAWYELMRSFIITWEKGPNYKEGLLLRIFRVIGLLIPGIPAHTPQDYVNSTRLGGSQLFLHQY
ncbi:hypothetical protein EUGRSUZ_H01681 [Eucalyptus grandis]|uniref:Uncharacterized protein n=1 Tax=Eucalyptus grandis TaxID=71139 RepID=A0ACC3JRI2_EUCGR|nr:hypothetical protein EUGRSUZ_H01681 [Eucalyptus grandis]